MIYNFPEEFNPEIYRELHSDMTSFSEEELRRHYAFHGKEEGRVSNSIKSRYDFIPLIPDNKATLEIGPF